MRIYDPRLGRFLSVDPLTPEYPWYTPYQFAGNKPIEAIDLDGLEEMGTFATWKPYDKMIFNINLATEPKLHEKFKKLNNDLSMIQNYFQDKNYGISVGEIAGSIVCTTPFQLQFFGLGYSHSKKKKLISFLTKVDIDWVEKNKEQSVREECKRLLLQAFKDFDQLNIKNFNNSQFIEDFCEYLDIVEKHSLEELKELMPPLNDETRKVHEEKWKRFLNG